jgi:hypothetical protein
MQICLMRERPLFAELEKIQASLCDLESQRTFRPSHHSHECVSTSLLQG